MRIEGLLDLVQQRLRVFSSRSDLLPVLLVVVGRHARRDGSPDQPAELNARMPA
jgi:hypothetical protein